MVHASKSYDDAVSLGLVAYDESVISDNLERCIVGYNEDVVRNPDGTKKKDHTTLQYVRVFKDLKKDPEVFEGFKKLLRVLATCKLVLSTYCCVLLYLMPLSTVS